MEWQLVHPDHCPKTSRLGNRETHFSFFFFIVQPTIAMVIAIAYAKQYFFFFAKLQN